MHSWPVFGSEANLEGNDLVLILQFGTRQRVTGPLLELGKVALGLTIRTSSQHDGSAAWGILGLIVQTSNFSYILLNTQEHSCHPLLSCC